MENKNQSGTKSYFRVAFFMAVVLAVIFCFIYWNDIFSPSHQEQTLTTHSDTHSTSSNLPSAKAAEAQSHFPLEGVSLSDTQIEPFTVKKGPNGWILPPNLRYYFEYFIQLQGEIPLDKIKQLIRKDLAKKHPPELSQYLYDLFLRYLDYRKAIDELILYENDLENSQDDLENNELSKEQQLSEHIKALQNLNMDAVNDQVETIQEEYFNEAERKALFDEAFLERYSDEHTIKPKLDAYDSIKNTLTGDELQAARVTLFGSEAANRLQQLDQKREAWKNRLVDLQCKEIAIEQSSGLSAEDKRKQKQNLLINHFGDAEIRRIDALRRNNLLPTANCD